MDLYNAQLKFANVKPDTYDKKDPILAKFIHDDLDSMTSTEMKFFLLKCFDNEIAIKNELLKYEFNNLVPNTITKKITIEEYAKLAMTCIHRYHKKVGGFNIEDGQWQSFTFPNTKYELTNSNEIIFENTINNVDAYSAETLKFLIRLENILSNICYNFSAKIKFVELDRDKIVVIIIRCWMTDEIEKNGLKN